MTYKPPTEMYALLGRMIADWNSLEADMIGMIGLVSGAPDTTNILTAHMGSQAICNALKALAIGRLPEDVADHVNHAVGVFEHLRSYRNQFVHGITAVISDGPEAAAMTHGRRVNAKGEVLIDRGWLHRSELETMMGSQAELSRYFTYLGLHVRRSLDETFDPPIMFRHWPPEKIAIPPALSSRWEPDRPADQGS
ncbi:MAG: hypothetical protein EON92_16410 [Burkholderiales bacterium]|nr:MAG: hypothetical protein EON92_16410 [Burkholderiales bacterium]